MIVFGGNNFVQMLYDDYITQSNKWYTLNYFNIIAIGKSINSMFPPKELVDFYLNNIIDKITFDQQFANYIYENNIAFMSLMDIMMGEYGHGNVFVLYDDTNDLIIGLVETIIALIRERYSKQCSIVNELYDLYWIDESYMDEIGNANFEIDKNRYNILVSQQG